MIFRRDQIAQLIDTAAIRHIHTGDGAGRDHVFIHIAQEGQFSNALISADQHIAVKLHSAHAH